jgi:hypothetical protein
VVKPRMKSTLPWHKIFNYLTNYLGAYMNKMRLLLSALLIFGLTQETYTSWETIKSVDNKARYEEALELPADDADKLLSYNDLINKANGFKKVASEKSAQQKFRKLTGSFPKQIRSIYIFDSENNFISYSEERQIQAKNKTPDKRKSSGQSSPNSTTSDSNSSNSDNSSPRLSRKHGFFVRNGKFIVGGIIGYLLINKLRSMNGKRKIEREQRQQEQEA